MANDIPNANFPQKLFSLMENEQPSVVCWSERGLSFRVVDQEKFSEEVVPKYFRHTKMTSFQRQLNLYGFRRVTKGEDVGAYYHPKFQKGRRDLIAEIKRLPGKANTYGIDEKSKLLSEHRFIPHESNIVEIMGGNNRPVTMSKLTMKIAGINANTVPYASSNGHSTPLPPFQLTPTYVAENSVQFLSLPSADDSPRPFPTVYLAREPSDNNPPPLLHRNFSVSSAFDEEYRLPVTNEEVENDPNKSTSGPNVTDKPVLPVRAESESWVKLGALDQLNDMDPFDIDTVFE